MADLLGYPEELRAQDAGWARAQIPFYANAAEEGKRLGDPDSEVCYHLEMVALYGRIALALAAPPAPEPGENAEGLSVICRDCGTLISGVEAGNRVKWVVCERCCPVEPVAAPPAEPSDRLAELERENQALDTDGDRLDRLSHRMMECSVKVWEEIGLNGMTLREAIDHAEW